MTKISVTKRSGKREPLMIEKWQQQISKVCSGIADVSQSMIEIKSQPHFFNGITTREIDQITLRAIVDLINVEADPDVGHTNYQYVAGKQRLSMLRKDVFGGYEVPSLYSIVKANIAVGLYTPELLEWYTEDDWNKMDTFIDHSKDEKYTYAAIEQLIEKYLVKNRATGNIYETPQVRYMVAAATVFHNEEPHTVRMKYIKDYYYAASDGMFTLSTPVLAGLGTPTKQFSSCVLIKVDDNLDSIFASGEMMAKYASKRAGIGLEVGRIRPIGSPIRGGEIMHTGMTPFLKKFFGDLRSCSQGGIRSASATVYWPVWHAQFGDLITMKNNQGTDETRVRHLDYAVVLSAFFWRRFKNKENITFFDPNEVPDLYDAFYSDTALFEELYCKYEHRKDLRTASMSAEEVFKGGILKERTDTGRIYIMYTDNVQSQGSFDPSTDPIYQSNLCCLTGDAEIAVQRAGVTSNMPIEEFVDQFNQTSDGWTVQSWANGEVVWKPVTAAALTKQATELVSFMFKSGKILKCTPDHKIFTSNRGWVEAKDINALDDSIVGDGAPWSISTIKLYEPVPVYDITVEGTHAFFANGVLVHNCEILLPTVPFRSTNDEGEFELTLDNGESITLPGQHRVLLENGVKRKVRELTESDEIVDLLV